MLCYDTLDPSRADARTLVTLLHLRDIAARLDRDFSIVSEMLDLRNRALAEVARADDFIVSDRLVSLMIAQVAETKHLNAVFADLFDAEGSEIYLKPAGDYVAARPGGAVRRGRRGGAAARRDRVRLSDRGARRAMPRRPTASSVNPAKSATVTFAAGRPDRRPRRGLIDARPRASDDGRGTPMTRVSALGPRPWVMRMRWVDLLFAHWPIEPADAPAARARRAWSSITSTAAPTWASCRSGWRTSARAVLPAPPVAGAFPELNVRTYVRHEGRSGVWFLSLDAGSRAAVEGARAAFHLPYYEAAMTVGNVREVVDYRSVRDRRSRRRRRGSRPAIGRPGRSSSRRPARSRRS